MQTTITHGNRAVVISVRGYKVWANLYVNARNGPANADITGERWEGKTVAAATRWANKKVGI